MKQLFELRRQVLHIVFGTTIVWIYSYYNTPIFFLLILFVISLYISYEIKKNRFPILTKYLKLFEREKHIKKFPCRGLIFFILGSYLSLIFFTKNIAITSILILTYGDAFTNITGFYFGKKVHFLNKKKTIEGTIGGVLISFVISIYYVQPGHAFLASLIAIILEAPQLQIFNHEIDDNLIIPIVSGLVLSLLI